MKAKRPLYSERMEAKREERGFTIRELQEKIKEYLKKNLSEDAGRGTSYSAIRLYLSIKPPYRPRASIIKAAAEVLGVPYEWLMGETDDPAASDIAEATRQLKGRLGAALKDQERAVAHQFPEYRRLTAVAKAAVRDVTDAILTADAKKADRAGGDYPKRSPTEAAEAVGKALRASLEAVTVNPEFVSFAGLSDFAVLTCQGLKIAVRSQIEMKIDGRGEVLADHPKRKD